jgi:hypothetical protein
MVGKNGTSLEQMNSLGFSILSETKINMAVENHLCVNINIPILSYVLLNERYNANVGEELDKIDADKSIIWQLIKNGKIVSFNKLFELQTDISYSLFISDHIGFDLQYRLLFYSFDQYKDLFQAKYLNNQFLLGLLMRL